MDAMIRQTMEPSDIEEIHEDFMGRVGAEAGQSVPDSWPGAYDAIEVTARAWGLAHERTERDGDGHDVARLYRDLARRYVNAWVRGDRLGFDDQTEIHEGQA